MLCEAPADNAPSSLSLALPESPSMPFYWLPALNFGSVSTSHPLCPGCWQGGGRELIGIKWLDAQPFFTSAHLLTLVTAKIYHVLAARPYGS